MVMLNVFYVTCTGSCCVLVFSWCYCPSFMLISKRSKDWLNWSVDPIFVDPTSALALTVSLAQRVNANQRQIKYKASEMRVARLQWWPSRHSSDRNTQWRFLLLVPQCQRLAHFDHQHKPINGQRAPQDLSSISQLIVSARLRGQCFPHRSASSAVCVYLIS